MLLTKVGLKNFMKHESLDVDLEAGMNVIRGSNEAGKSSLLTGIAYNWFGASALPQTVDDTVTWGAKKSAMKTKTDFTIGEDYYVCYRSISGAELYKGDAEAISGTPLVTGHKEVSAAIANLFDLPSVNAAFELQIASQNSVRGVISLGATAAAAFIEKLIDMNDIDDMIKDVSEKLTHNNESKKQALENVESLTTELSNLAKPSSTGSLQKEVSGLKTNLAILKDVVELSRAKSNEAEFTLRELQSEETRMKARQTTTTQDIKTIVPLLTPPTESISEDDVADASVLLNRWIKYEFYTDEFLPLVDSRPEQEWDGDQKSFDDYVEGLERSKNRCLTEATELRAEHRVLQSQIITETTCPTCGHELVDLKKTEKRNADLVAKQDNLTVKIDKYVVDAEETGLLIKEANVLSVFQRKQELWLAKNRQRVSVTTDTVPHRISILGELPVKPADPMSQRVFDEMVQKKSKLDQVMAKLKENQDRHDNWILELNDVNDQLVDVQEKIDTSTIDMENAKEDYQDNVAKLTEMSDAHSAKRAELSIMEAANAALEENRKALVNDIAKWKKTSEEIQRNAGLISALRSARLDISTLLWQKLLGVTETYFSLFRGKTSTLSMSAKGILVDDRLSAPSGSTLDILGLALRLAMSKLFANNGLCILDEPSAGCDDERTAAMTAGLLSSGFDQVLMVTHKDLDEQAGNLILI